MAASPLITTFGPFLLVSEDLWREKERARGRAGVKSEGSHRGGNTDTSDRMRLGYQIQV